MTAADLLFWLYVVAVVAVPICIFVASVLLLATAVLTFITDIIRLRRR